MSKSGFMTERRTGRKVPAITPDRLRQLVSYEPETGVFTWLSSPRPSYVGRACNTKPGGSGYLYLVLDRVMYSQHRLAWLYMTGEWPSDLVDHIDTDRANNRWGNLRAATYSQNKCNAGLRSDNKSGVKGVFRDGARWLVVVQFEGHRHTIGSFKTIEEAALRYAEAARDMHGEFARVAA